MQYSSVTQLRHRSEQLGVELPPIAPEPSWWPAFLRIPTAGAWRFNGDPKDVFVSLSKRNARVIFVQAVFLTINYVAMALVPLGLGKLLDSGLERGLGMHLMPWTLVLLGLAFIAALGYATQHLVEAGTFLQGTITSGRAVHHRVAERGNAVREDIPAGDVVATIATDGEYIGAAQSFIATLIGTLISTVVVGVLMLTVSVPLGLLVLIGLPLVVASLSFIIKPLQERQAIQREAQGKLATLGTDAVSGLRILRGIGGEDEFVRRYREQSQIVRRLGNRVAVTQALLNALRMGLPGAFMTVVVAVAAFMVFDGRISAGDLVAFYGYTSFLATPLMSATMAIQVGTRAWVAAKKIAKIHAVSPIVSDECENGAQVDFARARLHDVSSGITIEPGRITALVCQDPDKSARVATRLARTNDLSEVTYDGIEARRVPLQDVRKHIVLATAENHLFTGTLRDNLQGAGASARTHAELEQLIFSHVLSDHSEQEWDVDSTPQPDDRRLLQAMYGADAQDVLDSMPGGLDGTIAEKGRSLSGGQRQRVALARALVTDADVLIAIEPTSAVDSHTESRIAQRLSGERAGRTTVIVTTSPLVLERCDEVVLIHRDGTARVRSTHSALMQAAHNGEAVAQEYRRVVERTTGGDLA
ncbi:MAG: ABC transporter ATP-binding protein [Actinomycetaceae bacterium]|nr:ABC transporter ATP-binding protein [Actinomycetaceae bacterium]